MIYDLNRQNRVFFHFIFLKNSVFIYIGFRVVEINLSIIFFFSNWTGRGQWIFSNHFHWDCFIAATPSQSSLMSVEFSLALTLASWRLYEISNCFSSLWQSKSGTGVEQRISFLKIYRKEEKWNKIHVTFISQQATTKCQTKKNVYLPKWFIHHTGIKIAHFAAHFSQHWCIQCRIDECSIQT